MTQRTARLSELIREELGELIHDELKDPRIGFVTVTGVEVSSDIRHADVHLSIMGSEKERERTLQGIKSATGHLRKELGRRIRVKFTPELKFHLDTSADHSAQVGKILSKLKSRGELGEEGSGTEGEEEQGGRGAGEWSSGENGVESEAGGDEHGPE